MGSEENSNRSVFEKKNGVGVDPFYGSGWDPIGSLNQSGNFGNSCMDPNYAVMLENHIMGSGSSSHLVNFPSDPSLVSSLLPNVPTFGSGSFSEMVTSFGQSNFARNPEDGVFGASPNGKKKRKVPTGALVKNGEEKQQHGTAEFPEEDYEKKQNLEHNAGTNSGSDQTVKQAKDKSNDPEPSNENYVHIRAKRGQATNSHSLAERVRRERISERMRLLQELVPGCSKITGKAVMLDEIINYVQSLQQQVEFLSMKLATVNPEVNVDIERMLSKNILQSRGISSTALGNGLTSTPSHPFSGYLHGTFSQAPNATSSFHPFPHNLRNNNELQSILQMGFDSNPSVSSLGPNGMEQ